MKASKKVVHFTFMPGEIASELCGSTHHIGCKDAVSGKIELVTCPYCLDELYNRAYNESGLQRKLEHVIDTLGWVVDTLKAKHMDRRGIPSIIKEVDKRMTPLVR